MLFRVGVVTGLIIGWVIEWVIDWRFWRQNLNESLDEETRQRAELECPQREIQNLQDQLAAWIAQAKQLAQKQEGD